MSDTEKRPIEKVMPTAIQIVKKLDKDIIVYAYIPRERLTPPPYKL